MPFNEAKPAAGAWMPDQVVDFMMDGIAAGKFYIICPDNEVTEAMDTKRMQWAAEDLLLNSETPSAPSLPSLLLLPPIAAPPLSLLLLPPLQPCPPPQLHRVGRVVAILGCGWQVRRRWVAAEHLRCS